MTRTSSQSSPEGSSMQMIDSSEIQHRAGNIEASHVFISSELLVDIFLPEHTMDGTPPPDGLISNLITRQEVTNQ
ncbi:hypothetical protein T265_05657 [Opisthorchis viverrini]|uniref:Uncharacterized protein n=1 Tax=Opisthorchis viverrini TaxID=6198 RepID=A0A074ZIV1_OPIVI|nr:hypothetical protein T265_05657 [Opisthorchis viverrini]KER27253.1 hypothetical protein T265_05657 [Opisthorchis viverrini]